MSQEDIHDACGFKCRGKFLAVELWIAPVVGMGAYIRNGVYPVHEEQAGQALYRVG